MDTFSPFVKFLIYRPCVEGDPKFRGPSGQGPSPALSSTPTSPRWGSSRESRFPAEAPGPLCALLSAAEPLVRTEAARALRFSGEARPEAASPVAVAAADSPGYLEGGDPEEG